MSDKGVQVTDIPAILNWNVFNQLQTQFKMKLMKIQPQYLDLNTLDLFIIIFPFRLPISNLIFAHCLTQDNTITYGVHIRSWMHTKKK